MCASIARLLGRLGFDVAVVGPSEPAPSWVARHGAATLWQARAARRAVGDADLVVTTGHLGWPGPWGGRRIHVYAGNLVRQARHLGGPWHWRLRWGLAGGVAEALSARGATVVAASQQAADDAARLYRARIAQVVPLGVDTDLFRPRDRAVARARLALPPQGRLALFVGRGEPGKGPAVALEACRRAGFELLCAGTRPVEGSRPLGVLSQVDLAWAYAAADAVVLPTHYEGFGYVAVEAVACGVPIVTTPTGWTRELWAAAPSYRPLLVPPEPDAVARALSLVAGDGLGPAVDAARAHVLEHNCVAAFEHRFTAVLEAMDALPLPR